MIRIANGQGFWGDWLEAPVRLIEQGPIDYLVLDYLAEVTMSILQKQRKADPNFGYARDFPPLMGRVARLLRDRNVKVLANAGGINPLACAREVRRLAPDLKIAIVLGDDVLNRIDEFLAQGQEMRNIDTGEPLTSIRDRITSANAYLGAFPLAQALATGADVVISGRCADAALALAPMIHRFGWKADDWNRLSAGIIAGHIIECGAQSTGGNCIADWKNVPDFANIGYPIVEAEPDGTFCITKHPGTGGLVNLRTIKEQLLYEIGDPRHYITPDVIADFTSVRLAQADLERVRATGIIGLPQPAMLKLSISYAWGWKAIGTLVYSAPEALQKAEVADSIVRERLDQLGLEFDAVYTEFFGVNAVQGPAAMPCLDPPEVQLRMGARGHDKRAIDRFTRELIPLVLTGPPTGTGYGEGRPSVREVIAYWPAIISRDLIQPHVEVIE
jgi:Acyclic terpene utilisation family protein AtuA